MDRLYKLNGVVHTSRSADRGQFADSKHARSVTAAEPMFEDGR
jgi:hypothetical protein